MGFLKYLKREGKMQRDLLSLCEASDHGGGSCGLRLLCKHRKNGRIEFYYIRSSDGIHHYINMKDLDVMRDILEQERCRTASGILKKNIALITEFENNYTFFTRESVDMALGEVYKEAARFLAERDAKRSCTGSSSRSSEKCAKGIRASSDPPDPLRCHWGSSEHWDIKGLMHTTHFGLAVRSKGEAMIAEALYSAGMDFHYEKKLVLSEKNGRTVSVYPDFTIDTGSGEYMYWEHKGMMGDPSYATHDAAKMRLYFHNGIYQPENLIVTCDGPDGSFNLQNIYDIINGIIRPRL